MKSFIETWYVAWSGRILTVMSDADDSLRSLYSLTVNPVSRPTPGEMLKHPWLVEQQGKKVNMEKWIAQVWGWDLSPSSTTSASSAGHHLHHKTPEDRERRRRERGERKRGTSGTPSSLSMGSVLADGHPHGAFEGSSGGSVQSPDSDGAYNLLGMSPIVPGPPPF